MAPGSFVRIDSERCSGCGACMEVCPTGALYLVDGRAVVDQALCRGCEACVTACPVGAIRLVTREEPAAEVTRLPAVRSEPEVIRIRTSAPVPVRSRAMPVVGAALAWAGREILPRLADIFLDRLDRRAAERQLTRASQGRDAVERGGKGGGRRHRHRGGRG
ncbi:MAG: 4Fe-4S binding protein [Anaerolineae bacterium]|nr:4Fe-4S binding protein [Anaerolineae bacterium]